MTNFERAKQSQFDMAVSILFCVAAYEEQKLRTKLSKNDLTNFIKKNVDSIIEWLNVEEP